MLPGDFARQLERASGQPAVLVAGPEALIAELCRDAMRAGDVDDTPVGQGPAQLREAVELWETPSWFGVPRLVVAYSVEGLSPRQRATKERDLELGALERLTRSPGGENRLLLWAPEADRRLRPVRLMQERGALIDASTPQEREYRAWVSHLADREGARLTPGALQAYCESALDLLSLQGALRVGALCAGEDEVSEEVARWAAPPGGELKVFAFTDALLSRDDAGIARSLPRLLRQGESPIGMVALAARQLRLVAKALALRAQGLQPKEIEAGLGVHPFVARKVAQSSRRWSPEDLRRALFALLECDLGLKSGAQAETALLVGLASAVRRTG